MEEIIQKLYELVKERQEHTFSMDYGEARWRDGYEQGLITAIEILESDGL